jgi:protein-tyrosine-phosphatase
MMSRPILVLFACVHGAGRFQMAVALFNAVVAAEAWV